MTQIEPSEDSADSTTRLSDFDLSDEQWAQLENLLAQGQNIAAIKAVRQWQHLPLYEAKTLVDQHHARLCEIGPQRFNQSSASPGCSTKVGMSLLVMGLSGAWAI